MSDWRRPLGRLFFGLIFVGMTIGESPAAMPTMTTVADTVYRVDGAPAVGTLLISWPAFSTANGTPVAAGTKSVPLGPLEALPVIPLPNAGSVPAETFYAVVFLLVDSVRTGYW